MSSPFTSPASTTGIDYQALNGRLLIITPLAVEAEVMTSLGVKEALRADVAVIDGEQAGITYGDVLIFPRVLISQLRSRIGSKVLGRLGQGVAKPGQNPPWILADATPADQQAGVAFLARTGLTSPAAPATGSKPPF